MSEGRGEGRSRAKGPAASASNAQRVIMFVIAQNLKVSHRSDCVGLCSAPDCKEGGMDNEAKRGMKKN